MAGFTKKSEHNAEFAKGGKTKMFGEQEAADMPSGTTDKGDKSGPGEKFASGGSTKMFGYAGSLPRSPARPRPANVRVQGIKPMGVGAPKAVPSPGSVSSVGPTGAAPKPRLKNTRDYGKTQPAAPSPMSSPSPFGPTQGGSRIGGI